MINSKSFIQFQTHVSSGALLPTKENGLYLGFSKWWYTGPGPLECFHDCGWEMRCEAQKSIENFIGFSRQVDSTD